ncbi:MAG: penicillin acylase family protein [Acidobacteriia bacterium]|nr:penicillin acylase family protein [Terriglobia bacterium]
MAIWGSSESLPSGHCTGKRARKPTHGETYIAAVEFSNPVKARVLLTYGNSSQPDSPHQADQLPLLARKELRTAWRTKTEVMSHLESRNKF